MTARPILPALAMVVVATLVSQTATGFYFGTANNVFHIPFVLRLAEGPAFRDDAFYQSLTHFASLLWLGLRALCTEQNVESVFFIGHVAGRGLAFAALLAFLRINGPARPAAWCAALIVAAACPWLSGYSVVGGHGLFVNYFTHSETTWGPIVLALLAAQHGRLAWAAALAGVVFSINAFIAIWLIVVLAFTVAANPDQRSDWRRLLKACVIFVAVSAPMSAWIASALGERDAAVAFSYIDYIRTYYPDHFLIEAASPAQLRQLALFLYCAAAAAALLKQTRFWLAAVAGCVALLAAGAVLPYLIDHHIVFNLCLMRSAGLLQFLAVILTLAAASTIWAESDNPAWQRLLAVLMLGSLMSMQPHTLHLVICAVGLSLLIIARNPAWLGAQAGAWSGRLAAPAPARAASAVVLAVGLADLLLNGASASSALRVALLLLAVVVIGRGSAASKDGSAASKDGSAASKDGSAASKDGSIVIASGLVCMGLAVAISANRARERAQQHQLAGGEAQRLAMLDWVRNSALPGPFLFPTHEPYRQTLDDFQLRTRKTVWVDYKQGAAVMWAPTFHRLWMPRFQEVSALKTPEALADYALSQGIRQLVLPLELGPCPSGTSSLYGNAAYAVCAVEQGLQAGR